MLVTVANCKYMFINISKQVHERLQCYMTRTYAFCRDHFSTIQGSRTNRTVD
jgi:hypothetical protein